MTTSALIDLVLTHTEEVGSSDGENTTMRARILSRAQEMVDKVWNYADWDFKKSSGSVTITNGSGALPSDFGDFGDDGGVYITASRKKLRYVEPRDYDGLVETEGSSASVPDFYTVKGYNSSTYTRTLRVYPQSASATLSIYYNTAAPTLVDETTDTNMLQAVPAQYHRPVILKGVQWLVAIDKGDGRTSEFDAWADRELRAMKSRHVFGREQAQPLGTYGFSRHRSW